MEPAKQFSVSHKPSQNRFEATIEGLFCVLDYLPKPGKLVLVHTEVPPPLRGRGMANQLAAEAFSFAGSHGLKIVPQCPFIADYVTRHPEVAHLVVAS